MTGVLEIIGDVIIKALIEYEPILTPLVIIAIIAGGINLICKLL